MKKKKLFLPAVLLLLLVSYINSDKLLAVDHNPLPSGQYEIPVSQGKYPEVCLERMGYTVSFNPQTNIPNWVAWELNAEKLIERESRNDKFLPDPDIDERQAITTDEYKGSGWDRGHMCPAGDNRWHWRAMDESFYMTNICPQNHNLNRGDWKELEEACRRWAAVEPIYIVCGPILYKTPQYESPMPSSRSYSQVSRAVRPVPWASSTRMSRATINVTSMSTPLMRLSALLGSTSSQLCPTMLRSASRRSMIWRSGRDRIVG